MGFARIPEVSYNPEGATSMPVIASHRNKESENPKPGGRYNCALITQMLRTLLATKIHKSHKMNSGFCIASANNEAESTIQKKVRSRQHDSTYLASNAFVQPRSGDTFLALGERGESHEPSVTQRNPGSSKQIVLAVRAYTTISKNPPSNRNIPDCVHKLS